MCVAWRGRVSLDAFLGLCLAALGSSAAAWPKLVGPLGHLNGFWGICWLRVLLYSLLSGGVAVLLYLVIGGTTGSLNLQVGKAASSLVGVGAGSLVGAQLLLRWDGAVPAPADARTARESISTLMSQYFRIDLYRHLIDGMPNPNRQRSRIARGLMATYTADELVHELRNLTIGDVATRRQWILDLLADPAFGPEGKLEALAQRLLDDAADTAKDCVKEKAEEIIELRAF
jgi:hypothetical protein